jgi:hypothetical protein
MVRGNPTLLGAVAPLPSASAGVPTPRATDGTKGGPNQRGSSGDLMLPSAVAQLLPTPAARDWKSGQSNLMDANARPLNEVIVNMPVDDGTNWGPFADAIARWERILGCPAPDPRDHKGRLAPPFVEWMMGLPAGWVTDVPELSRSDLLRLLGNGVVRQQGAAGIRSLLPAAPCWRTWAGAA